MSLGKCRGRGKERKSPHGDPNTDVELRVDISAEVVTLETGNRVVYGKDLEKRRRQYHTRFGIRVGGAGKGLDTLSQLFDYAEFRWTCFAKVESTY